MKINNKTIKYLLFKKKTKKNIIKLKGGKLNEKCNGLIN